MFRRFLPLAIVLIAACGANPDYAGTAFSCDEGVCPAGFACVAGGCLPDEAGDGASLEFPDGGAGGGGDAQPDALNGDCVVSEWSEWSTCSAVCGPGTTTRSRTVVTPAQRLGADCPALEETTDCQVATCITTLLWSDKAMNNIYSTQLASPGNTILLSSLADPAGIAVDAVAGYIFVADPVSDKVTRARLDGTEGVVLLNRNDPWAVALDPVNQHVFVTDSGDHNVMRMGYDGSNPVAFLTNIDNVRGIAIDPINRRLYVSEIASDTIRAHNLDTGVLLFTLVGGMSEVVHLAIDLVAGKLFWVDAVQRRIVACNLDGTEAVTVVADLSAPVAIAVDPYEGYVYWADHATDRIYRVPRAGGATQEVRQITVLVNGLAIY